MLTISFYHFQNADFELTKISNKVRFILMVVDDKLKINKRKRKEIEADLERHGFDKLDSLKKKVIVTFSNWNTASYIYLKRGVISFNRNQFIIAMYCSL